MATRRSQATSIAQSEASGSTSLKAELELDRLSTAFASWEAGGQDIVEQILSAQTDSDLATASTVPVTNTIISMIRSEVGIEGVARHLAALSEAWEAQRKEVLWEALVDAVAVLSEDLEDSRDLRPQTDMEIDGQQTLHPGEKGVQVIKSLLVRFERSPGPIIGIAHTSRHPKLFLSPYPVSYSQTTSSVGLA